ncbi:hypothetical protein Tco_0247695 [Tanacetum coccineum]
MVMAFRGAFHGSLYSNNGPLTPAVSATRISRSSCTNISRDRDEIYSTVDACQTAQEMWKAIESYNKVITHIQMSRQNYLEFGHVTSTMERQIESLHKILQVMNEMIRHNLTVARCKSMYNFFNNFTPEWKAMNRAERMAKNALTISTCCYASNNARSFDPNHQNITNNIQASLQPNSCSTRYKWKRDSAKQSTYCVSSEEDSDLNSSEGQRYAEEFGSHCKVLQRETCKPTTTPQETSSNTRTRMGIRSKRVRTPRITRKRCCCVKQAEKGVPLQAEQSDWLADTDEEIDEQELEAHYSYMAKIQEVPNADSGTDAEPLEQVHYNTDHNVFANDLQHFEQSESIRNTCAVETSDSNVIPDSPDMCDNDI